MTPMAKALEQDDMRRLGIDRTAGIARAYNRGRRRDLEARRRAYDRGFEELLAANGWSAGTQRLRMEDGLCLDTSGTLPHLDRLIEEMNEAIEERGGHKWEDLGKPFLQNILPRDAAGRWPSLVDFATSSEMVSTVAPCFGFIPHLSTSLPRGIRLQESSTKHDPRPGPPWRSSQLWHRDYHSDPTVYVVVIIREITGESGPLTYLSASASERVSRAYDYRSRGAPYRLSDEQVNAVVEPSEIRELTGPPGTVLFIDSSACFHFGSRNAVVPRYQVQYAYVSPVKNDFSEIFREQLSYPAGDGASSLRRMVVDRDWTPNDRTG